MGLGTTPQWLRLARNALILAAILVGLTGIVVVNGALQSVERADSRTSRALIAARQAHASLADADRAAVHSFVSGDVLLGGPGQRYQDSIKTANQAIGQLAEALGGDSRDSAQLQNIDAELVTYVGLIEQADAAHRAEAARATAQDARAGLGEAYLWYASRMLHGDELVSGLLDRVDQVGENQEEILAARSWWLGGGALLSYLAAVIILLGCMIAAQLWMTRRFRRMVNLPLAVATVCALGVCGWAVVDLVHVQRTYASAERNDLKPLLGQWKVRSAAAEADGQSGLASLLAARCPVGVACRSTVVSLGYSVTLAAQTAAATERTLPGPQRAFGASLGQSLDNARTVTIKVGQGDVAGAKKSVQSGETAFNAFDSRQLDQIQATERSLANRMDSAQNVPGLRVGIVILSVLVMILAFLGIGPRLNEYWTG